MRSNLSVISVYNKKNTKSKVVTQLLYGDAFKILKKNGALIKIKNDLDNYKGFIKKKKFLQIKKIHTKYTICMQNYTQSQKLRTCLNKNYVLDPKLKCQKKKITFINLIIYGLTKRIWKKLTIEQKMFLIVLKNLLTQNTNGEENTLVELIALVSYNYF